MCPFQVVLTINELAKCPNDVRGPDRPRRLFDAPRCRETRTRAAQSKRQSTAQRIAALRIHPSQPRYHANVL